MMYYHGGNGTDGTTPAGWVASSLAHLTETAGPPPWTDATADSERTGTMSETKDYTRTCPVCQGLVGVQEDGTLFPHKRYADGAGYGPDQPHDLVPCEGGQQS